MRETGINDLAHIRRGVEAGPHDSQPDDSQPDESQPGPVGSA
jgi:hypothetical protein